MHSDKALNTQAHNWNRCCKLDKGS